MWIWVFFWVGRGLVGFLKHCLITRPTWIINTQKTIVLRNTVLIPRSANSTTSKLLYSQTTKTQKLQGLQSLHSAVLQQQGLPHSIATPTLTTFGKADSTIPTQTYSLIKETFCEGFTKQIFSILDSISTFPSSPQDATGSLLAGLLLEKLPSCCSYLLTCCFLVLLVFQHSQGGNK